MLNIIIAVIVSIVAPFFVKNKHSQLVFAIGMPLLFVLQLLLMQVSHEYDTISFAYAVPIVFSVTQIYLNFAVFVSILWLLASVYSVFYMSKNYGESSLAKFMPYYNAAVGFAILTTFASNLFTTFVFYELLTLATLPLVGFGEKDRKSLTKYAMILLFCSMALFLPAIFMFQGMVGTTEFMQGDGTIMTIFGQDFSQNESTLSNYQYTPTPFIMVVIFVMMLFGLAKSAIFPFNAWLPAAMCAPAPVSALLHAVAIVKIGVFVLYKVIYELYGMQYMLHLQSLYPHTFTAITTTVVFGIIIASIQALQTFDLKRILAFSTISNMGYITLLFLTFSETGMQAGFWHIFVHGVTKIGLFFIAGILYSIYHTNNYRRMSGAFNRHTILAFAFVLFTFSITGLPLTAGFISKQFTIYALADFSYIALFGILFSCVTCAIYMFRPVIYTTSATKKHIVDNNISTITYTVILPLALLNCLIFAVGFFWHDII